MGKEVVLLPEAEADVEAAFAWYELREAGLGRTFIEAVKTARVAIAAQPDIYPLYGKGFRRYLVQRFPYALHYRQNGDTVFIVAASHQSRHPKWLKARLRHP